nr:unnamed protein product [Digitaria exilis]
MPMTLHRKIASSFKDQFLLQIFQISLSSLNQLKSEAPDDFGHVPIDLALKCLSFDFVGSPVDESSEEFGTVQLPASWRPLLQDPSTVQIFFDYYKVNDTCVSKELAELLSVEFYGEWIGLVAEFTTRSLLSWQWASNSVYYLLSLWSRLVTSVPYLKGEAPSLLDETVPKITEGFITSRINSVQAILADNSLENPLDSVEVLQDQLEFLPYLCRFQYQSSSLYIINIMEPLLQAYTERSRLPAPGDSDELSVIEGQIAWMVHIIAAILKIRQTVGVSQESQEFIDAELSARVLQLISMTDTGAHTQCEDVIDHTLSLFMELASGYMTGKLLIKLESVAFNLEASPDAAFWTDVAKRAFIGWMRDLRGIAMATNSRKTYGLLFDWLYPSRMPLLLRAITLWTDEPEVTTPLLKFMCEFVLNKAQRLTFDSASPNGILLFREVSKIIVAYGSRILLLPNGTDIYRTLCGNYVNFGVFELYGDRALADALDISLKMTLSVPLSDILAFRKCASAIDSLAAFYFNNITAGDAPPSPAAVNLARHIGELPNLFPQILKTLFEIILFEDAGNQWSLSRPILSLIMTSEQMFSDLRAHILASQVRVVLCLNFNIPY